MTDVNFTESRLFKRLPASITDQLFEAGEVGPVEAGTYILVEGRPVDKLYIVLAGSVEVLLSGAGELASAIKLADFGPGEFFGEYAFVDGGPASATVRAVDTVTLYAIPPDTLRNFLNDHPDVALIVYKNLMEVLVERLRASNAELDLLAFSI